MTRGALRAWLLLPFGLLLLGGCGGLVDSEAASVPVVDAGGVPPPLQFPDAGHSFDVFVPARPVEAGGGRLDTGVATRDGTFDVLRPVDAPGETSIVDSGVDSFLADGGWLIAPHYPMPTVTDYGGNVIAKPVLTAVTFPHYDLLAEAQQFVSSVGSTPYWASVVGEYGVGPGTANPPIELTETPPVSIDDSAVQTWLAGKLDGAAANAAFGTPTSQSVYVIFYPTGTSVTLQGLMSCVEGGFDGYHNSVQLTAGPWSGLNVTYAVVPECAYMVTAAESLSETASHELIEATTDPLPLTQMPTYASTDENDIVWDIILGGGEVADMCAQNPNAEFLPAGFIYPVQRSWSNQAALAGHDPCQPAQAGIPYFNSIPRLNAAVNLTYQGQIAPTYGLSIPIGGKETVEVDLFSDASISDWTVSASDLSEDVGGGPYLGFSWDQTTGNNGTKLHLTITVLKAGVFGGQPFEIASSTGSLANYWLGFVGQ